MRPGWTDVPWRLRVALLLAVLGAALAVVGPALGVVNRQPAAGYAAMPLLVALAVVAPLLAGLAVWRGRPVVAAGVLIGSALLAPGRAVIDLQFAKDALLASRPELMVPTSLAPLSPASGLWVLIAGHVVIALAGVLASGRAGARPGSVYADEFDDPVGVLELRQRRYVIGLGFACATLAAVSLLLPAFQSRDAFLLTPDVFDGAALVRTGALLVAAAVVLGCVFAGSAAPPGLVRGTLLGLLAAVAGVTLPGIVAGIAVERLDPTLGPYLGLASVGVLTLAAYWLPRVLARRDERGDLRDPAEQSLELDRLHRIAGILGLLAGAAALVGALGAQLVVDEGLERPASFANRQLLPVAILIALLGAAILIKAWSNAIRPAFTVSLASVFLVGAGTLDAALTATAISDAIHAGVGVWFTGVAMILASAAAGFAALAGASEREDVDLTERGVNLAAVIPATAAVLLAVGAFGMPAVKAPGFVAPGIWTEFRLASWGLLLGLIVVAVVAVLAALSRPVRAASLLLGAAAVVAVHLLELPLTGARTAQTTAGQGTWLSLACVVALAITAIVALTSRSARGR
jgi:hypothetical protein